MRVLVNERIHPRIFRSFSFVYQDRRSGGIVQDCASTAIGKVEILQIDGNSKLLNNCPPMSKSISRIPIELPLSRYADSSSFVFSLLKWIPLKIVMPQSSFLKILI